MTQKMSEEQLETNNNYDAYKLASTLLTEINRRKNYLIVTFILSIFISALASGSVLGSKLFALDFILFCASILLSFCSLMWFCWHRLKQSKLILEGINRHLKSEMFHQIQENLLDSFQQKKSPNEQEKWSIAHQQISDLQSAFQDILQECHQQNWPFFVSQRLSAITETLKACKLEPDNSTQLLQAAQTTLPPEQPHRSLGQMLVSMLLFIGIIGTFYGLLDAFTSQAIGNLIRTLIEPQQADFSEPLQALMSGFGLAFGTSMIAYIVHLGGRFMLEQTDEDYDHLTAYLDFGLLNNLYIALSPLNIQIRVELSNESRDQLENQAKLIAEAAKLSTETIEKTVELTDNILQASRNLDKTIIKIDKTATIFLGQMQQTEKIWNQTNLTWITTTQQFSKTASDLILSVTEAVSRLDTLIKTIDEKATRTIDQWSEHSQKVLDGIEKTATNITNHWNNAVNGIIKSLSGNVVEYEDSLKKFQNQLKTLIQDLDNTHQIVKDASTLVGKGQETLNVGLVRLVDTETEIKQEVISHSLTNTVQIQEHQNELLERLLNISQNMQELTIGMEKVITTLGAVEGEKNLVETLQSLETVVQVFHQDHRSYGRNQR